MPNLHQTRSQPHFWTGAGDFFLWWGDTNWAAAASGTALCLIYVFPISWGMFLSRIGEIG